jgi:protein TonB
MPFTQQALRAEADVVVEFVIDESGGVRDPKIVRSPHPDFNAATLTAVGGWKFLPGRKRGRTVATRVDATLQFRPGRETAIVSLLADAEATALAAPDRPPQLLSSVPPEYPLMQHVAGVGGHVTVEFIVDPDGSVRDPRAVNSTHTAFEEPALAAVRKWRFAPGTNAGRPVRTRVQQVITFTVDETKDASAPVPTFPPPPTDAGAPRSVADLIVAHRTPQLLFSPGPVVPPGSAGREADVTIDLQVDREGRVVEAAVALSTDPRFNEAALAAVRRWRFSPQPARVDARVLSALRYQVHFRRDPAHPVATEIPTTAQ